MSQLAAFTIQPQIQLRFLNANDTDEVKSLCKECFPIEYPDSWYEQITSNQKFYSLSATYNNRIIGMIICELKSRTKCNKEDTDILASYFPATTQCAYILSLAVSVDFRRHGIASQLLDSLVSYLTTNDNKKKCKVIYLHVLTMNLPAIKFYENRNFKQQSFLPCYYSIGGNLRDGFTYALYINGGQPQLTAIDYIKQASSWLVSLQLCGIPHRLASSARNLWTFLTGSSSQTLANTSAHQR